MSDNIKKLQSVLGFAMTHRPKIGGFPYMAECLRRADVQRNTWILPACQSLYIMKNGAVISQMTPLETSMADIPFFDEHALVAAIRADQAGHMIFPDFLRAIWEAGTISYDVDFNQRSVTYYSVNGEIYREYYPEVLVEMGNSA